MKDYIRPPRLSTSFSQNGIRVRNRFANILDMRKKRRGIIAVMLIVSISLMFGGCFSQKTEPGEDEGIHVAVLGVDASGERSDVILLAGMAGDKLTVTQIPRDTYVDFNDGMKIGKIAEPADIMTCISNLMDVHCTKYVKVDYEGLENMVDAIGGIDFKVPVDMQYSDPYQDLSINICTGERHLDGEALEKVIRYIKGNVNENGTYEGYENGDLDRLAVQRSIYTAISAKLLESGITSELPKIIVENVDTNLTVSDFAEIIKRALKLTPENISIEVLDGQYTEDGSYRVYNGVSYIDRGERIYLSNEPDTETFNTVITSARVNGVDYDITKDGIRDSLYKNTSESFYMYYEGFIGKTHRLRLTPYLKVSGKISCYYDMMDIETGMTAASGELDIGGLTADGGTFTLKGIDSDAEFIVELTQRKNF